VSEANVSKMHQKRPSRKC